MSSPAIVVGYIDSATGRAALDRAIEEARLRDARLIVVHSMRGGSETPADDYTKYSKLLEGVESRLEDEGIRHEVHRLVRGLEPAEDISRTAEEAGADLIVIGYKRRSPAGKAFLGSDAQGILMLAPCPVLAVRV